MTAVLIGIVDHVWQSTACAVVVAQFSFALRRNRASVRYALWLAASVKFLVPFSVLVTIGRLLAPFARSTPSPAAPHAILILAQPLSRGALPIAPDSAKIWVAALVAMWLGGLVAIAGGRLRAWRRIQRALRTSEIVPVTPACPVPVRSSAHLFAPGVVGIRRPVVLLPSGIAQRLTSTQLQMVMAHEITHLRRHDNLTATLHMLVEAIFWFHPAVWWIGGRLLEERERACDEQVLARNGNPRAYAEAILTVCSLYPDPPLVCVAGVSKSQLTRRIEDIMRGQTGRTLSFSRKAVLATAAVVALAVPLAIGAMTTTVNAQGRSRGAGPGAAKGTPQEVALRSALFDLRHAIDGYYQDKHDYPRTLDDLVTGKYLKAIPTDPMTNSRTTWLLVAPKADAGTPTIDGVFDVRSGSTATSADGSRYSDW